MCCIAHCLVAVVGHFLLETSPIVASAWQDVCDHAGLAVGSRVRAHFYCHGQKSRSWREADRTWQSYQWGTVKRIQVWRDMTWYDHLFGIVHSSDRSEILMDATSVVTHLEAQVLAVGVEKRQGWEQRWTCISNCTDHQVQTTDLVQIFVQYLLCVEVVKLVAMHWEWLRITPCFGRYAGPMGPVTYGVLLEFGFGYSEKQKRWRARPNLFC